MSNYTSINTGLYTNQFKLTFKQMCSASHVSPTLRHRKFSPGPTRRAPGPPAESFRHSTGTVLSEFVWWDLEALGTFCMEMYGRYVFQHLVFNMYFSICTSHLDI